MQLCPRLVVSVLSVTFRSPLSLLLLSFSQFMLSPYFSFTLRCPCWGHCCGPYVYLMWPLTLFRIYREEKIVWSFEYVSVLLGYLKCQRIRSGVAFWFDQYQCNIHQPSEIDFTQPVSKFLPRHRLWISHYFPRKILRSGLYSIFVKIYFGHQCLLSIPFFAVYFVLITSHLILLPRLLFFLFFSFFSSVFRWWLGRGWGKRARRGKFISPSMACLVVFHNRLEFWHGYLLHCWLINHFPYRPLLRLPSMEQVIDCACARLLRTSSHSRHSSSPRITARALLANNNIRL